ncbi:hypothetical protein IMCC26207_108228 [Actinobacteria bacterium IMCC26207]|uniref:Unannotated protein n=1 Tax=freshwater metagenome TaxID=449393 RepID=A0A6J6PVC5_9ZZZZ|nr:hypothetical protein IMCC26207_108228 [Actinobacteria bacterium IMCC26207]MCX6523756.1 hypothetical protein [Actinomycetota bacterium]MSV47462.1 hypothetical protein [Actinomycetota bacterium]
MNNVVYLVLVVALSCVGMLLLWAKNRDPISPGSSVDQFQDKMQALAPPESETGRSSAASSDQGTSSPNRGS